MFSIERALAILAVLAFIAGPVQAQGQEPFEPVSGQAGKDVVWVPTPPELVEKMLDLAKVTADDVVIDLGSGDGRNIIAAAKRGARALGVEYNPQMVELSRRNAAAAGMSERARFVEGDMYVADISQASVMALFLLPSNMLQLRSTFLDLKPGSRIVSNTFGIEGWTPDATETIPDCAAWCNALLWIVPAKVAGAWQLPQGQLTLEQQFQVVSGTLATPQGSVAVAGKLNGDQITFTAGAMEYTGRVAGDRIEGNGWTATRK